MSAVPFANIPSNLRLPLFYAEVNNSQANTAQQNQRAILIAQMLSTGTATPNVPVYCSSVTQAKTLFGLGSDAVRMVAAYRNADTFGELWVLPLADASGSVAAAGSVAFTAAPTAPGVLSLYIAGNNLSVPITSTMTAAQVATAVVAAIAANTNLPITATIDGTNAFQVDIVAKNKGPTGNDIDIRLNYQGTAAGEVLPTGLAVTIVAMTAGATAPTLTTALANLGSNPFDFIGFPYTDVTSLNAMQAFMSDTTGRWAWSQQVYGHVFSAATGTVGALQTLGSARNDQHATILGKYDSPSSVLHWIGTYMGACAVSIRADPAIPLQYLALPGVLAPPPQSRFHPTDRNALLFNGIATYTVAADGTCQTENIISTYQLNAAGQPDNSYLEIETLFTLMLVLRTLAAVVTSKFSRCKLAADGTKYAAGSAIVTPSVVKAFLIAEYLQLETQGFVQGSAEFAAALIVQQNPMNPNRLDVLYPVILIDQLRIFALLAQFRLTV